MGRPQLGRSRVATAAVYLLADHLDAVLAAGEDLRALHYDVPAKDARLTAVEATERFAAEQAFVGRVRASELALIARVLQARVRAAEVVRADLRFRSIVGLFAGGTRPLVDAVADLGAAANDERRFNGSDDTLGYLRSRAMILADAASLDLVLQLEVGDNFRVAARIELGPLVDLAGTFLSALEMHYDLFEAADEAAALTVSAA